MPLTRGTVLGYHVARMTFAFTMVDDQIRTVQCTISAPAMDELDEGGKGQGKQPEDREAQFAMLRGRVEEIASELFDARRRAHSETVAIFYHHVRGRNAG
jgi:hypothetical protein